MSAQRAPSRKAASQVPSIEEAAARLVAQRVQQGLPPQVEDPVVLARIASLLRATHRPEQRPRRGAA